MEEKVFQLGKNLEERKREKIENFCPFFGNGNLV